MPGRAATWRWPRWASTSSTPTCWCGRSRTTRRRRQQHDFGKEHHPGADPRRPVFSYRFYDENKKAAKYWRDIGTLDAYYDANMDLCQVNPGVQPLRSGVAAAHLPAAGAAGQVRVRRGGPPLRQALDSMISSGCIVSGSRCIRQHPLPERARPQLLRRSRLDPDAGRARRPPRAHPPRDHRSRRAHSARRADRLQPEEDRRRHTVTEGGVVVVVTTATSRSWADRDRSYQRSRADAPRRIADRP